ncbi:ribosomal RNA-processing protein 12 [Dichomitus squalens LYAD-421 SS1]|uniref:ribosomal RNA-processing protein 12 n=1 Tax=Dichomitus squalens (strain LYAD-421) TaxID=732165 RepID=UPI0004415DAF|nr:ribosomal RNA-processing protein 12 [Dichomitus squalens LYAD-421 SS1]EJF65237.1 ribosomal RNA-processing protein 12 [Dichomitus squalens LYAD-421 SS1]
MADNVETALAKIRPHTSSALAHQKAPATLLRAIEATFREQNTEPSATAYFAALLTSLDGSLQSSRASGPALGDGDLLPAVLYLLAAVTPYIPQPVIRSHLSTIITLTSPLFPALSAHAPPLRSQLTLYGTVILALDRSQLDSQGLRQAFMTILQLTLDPRPKVRKKAAEIVKDVLAAPPPPSLKHPYAEKVAEWVKAALEEVCAGGLPKFKGKKAETEGSDAAIHLLAFLRPVLPSLPSESLSSITSSLLLFPRLGNPYLSQSAYSILSELLALSMDDPTVNLQSHMSELLKVILSAPPLRSDAALTAAWANVLGSTMLAYHQANPEECAAELGKVWKAIWNLLESSDAATRKAAADALATLGQCFTTTLIKAAVKEKSSDEPKSAIGKIIAQSTKALDSLAYARAIPDILAVVASLIENLKSRNGSRKNTTAAEQLLLPLITKVADLRVQKTFEYKETADATLGVAMRVLGPAVLLRVLPLNLEQVDRQAGREPRAFLLPLLAQPHPSPLGHFVSYFVPLTERMFELQSTAETEGRQSEAKVWSVLIEQIWVGLPGYCWGAPDLKQSLTAQFSQLLSQLLYGQPALRPAVLRALKVMVDSNVALASEDPDRIAKLPESVRTDPITAAEAQANIDFLRSQAESWLAVLFNVFGSVGRDNQHMVGDVISSWIAIADAKEVTQAYHKLVTLFKQNLVKAQSAPAPRGPTSDSVTVMSQDLLLLALPYLSPEDATALFAMFLTSDVLESRDNGVQKRGYKVLTRLVESGKVQVDAAVVLKKLEGLVEDLAAAAKKDRFQLLAALIAVIPQDALHLIPSIIPEAVLGTKEPSEKARNAAFDVIVAMGRKMAAGGVVKRQMLEDMADDGAGEAAGNIEEYLTMVCGGLAGASPHMISATVTAVSRLIFEFKNSISANMQSEIFTTLLVFVTSANREIVKSVLGFVKLAIHTMPADLIRPHLKDLVPALLKWSHDHKNHFKAKVRHIFERMLRRFGWEDVYACAQEEEARKVLLNIKKRKDRAKRKRANAADDEDEDVPKAKPAAGDAFEDVLYGSESEIEDSDEEDAPAQSAGQVKRKGKDAGARLRVDDDEPMDLLSGAASRVTSMCSANAGKRKKPGQDAAHFKIDGDTGKMVIDDSDEEGAAAAGDEDVEGNAYREHLTSVDGFTRGPNGKIKFNKDTKKRRRENEEADGDIEMADGEAQKAAGKKTKRKMEPKLGHEFKAKKAGGDVKKGGVDPYAYLSLSQAAKKQNRGSRIGIAGKR